MSEGYIQEEWNEFAEKVGQWIDKFFASRQFECLADSHKNEARGVIELFARYSYEYLGAKIRKTGTVPERGNVAWRNRFTESNVGERGNQEWRVRLTKLRGATRIVGVRRTWSKPCIVPPSILE
jgi:hypothetical protein